VDELRQGVLDAGWDVVLATVAAAHGLGDDPGHPAAAAWRDPAAAAHLGAVHEATVAGRHGSGTYYTPPRLVGWVLDRALRLDTRRLLDPACGAGAFLVPAVQRLADLTGRSPEDVVAGVHGTDLDPVAVAITRLLLRIAAPAVDPTVVAAHVRVADGLADTGDEPFDVVVGNPPFLGQLRRRTARAAAGSGPGAYTDTSALFLHRALDRVRPGGTVALVQPWSLLAARDAAPVRRAVGEAGAVTAFWASVTPVFTGTAVATCVPVVERAARQDDVATWHGPDLTPGPRLPMPVGEWATLVAPALGVPPVRPRTAGVVGDLATCTADFRDQYYGLVPYVREAADVPDGVRTAPLVTSGLVDPATSRWGRRTTRFAKTTWAAPVVDLDALADGPDERLARWARARLVPKVLVATQGRVLEAVADVHGAWLPSVPVLTVAAPPVQLYRVVGVLTAPPVVALAAARYAGTALSVTALKLAAGQVATLPLPTDTEAWDEGAEHARAAHRADDEHRSKALQACAEAMCAAYGDDSALAWWLDRARI
jgi:hypothetical protein